MMHPGRTQLGTRRGNRATGTGALDTKTTRWEAGGPGLLERAEVSTVQARVSFLWLGALLFDRHCRNTFERWAEIDLVDGSLSSEASGRDIHGSAIRATRVKTSRRRTVFVAGVIEMCGL